MDEKEKKQRRLFKYKQAGVVLTENQVKEIKAGRKKLRKEMRAMGIKSKKEFEVTASSLGLYFDKRRWLLLLPWLWGGKGLWALLGALLALLFALFLMSLVTQLRGHFTISLADEMFENGFVLSETEDFADPQLHLFSEPLEDAPCISIANIPEDVEDYEGTHGDGTYFAYTFWLRNEGRDTVDYTYGIRMNSESLNLSSATWLMLFENGEMSFHAEESAYGGEEALPAFGDDSRGYRVTPFRDSMREDQYELISTTRWGEYYRAIPIPFESEEIMMTGFYDDIGPMEVNKYTVVLWLEGDDPDCTDELIGGHLGIDMFFTLVENEEDEVDAGFKEKLQRLLQTMKETLMFWEWGDENN